MKYWILFLSACLTALPLQGKPAQEQWPDGSAMAAWFRQHPRPVRGREARTFDICDFGAVRDSTLLQTEAIQRTIDAAAVRGGTVHVPAGVWLSGALFFKPGTHLYLERGATLKGSTRTEDFPDVPVHIEGVLQPYAAALVNADACDGFSIRGEGTLDGNGLPYWSAYWARRKENPQCTNLEVRRPRMVSISRSRDVCIEGVTLRDAAFWNIHLYKCSRVYIDGVSIYAPVKPVRAPSSDGIDLDACSDVHILGSRFATCDDLIALKGGKGPWADEDPDNGSNARILVEDCYFGHGPGALVLGSECVEAENVILRRSTVATTDRLLWLKMRPDTPQRYAHILIEEVRGEVKDVLYIKPWTQFFDLKGRTDLPLSRAEDIRFRNCSLQCYNLSNVEKAPDQYTLSGVAFEDCEGIGGQRNLPLVDISADKERQVVVARGTPELYNGHPTTVLFDDGRTLFCTWSRGHGGRADFMSFSYDGGKTWHNQDAPKEWEGLINCPSAYLLTDPSGKQRLFVFATFDVGGVYREMAYTFSEDGGKTWSGMKRLGMPCIMAFTSIVRLSNGDYLGMYHRGNSEKDRSPLKLWQSISHDGGLSWDEPTLVGEKEGRSPCEPCVFYKPDGKVLVCVARENQRKGYSLMMFSHDEGKSWTPLKETPWGLTGDRHVMRYLPDGRMVFVFRDMAPLSPTKGHFVAWVGTYDELSNVLSGQYRIKLLHNYAGVDCGYPGLEVLPDGTIVATTYLKYRPGAEKHSVVSVRFRIEETDRLL